jgi:hypothetical protein
MDYLAALQVQAVPPDFSSRLSRPVVLDNPMPMFSLAKKQQRTIAGEYKQWQRSLKWNKKQRTKLRRPCKPVCSELARRLDEQWQTYFHALPPGGNSVISPLGCLVRLLVDDSNSNNSSKTGVVVRHSSTCIHVATTTKVLVVPRHRRHPVSFQSLSQPSVVFRLASY